MRVPVKFGKKKIEVECEHTVIIVNKKPKEIYRSRIFTAPNGKLVYVEFDPETGKVEIKEVER